MCRLYQSRRESGQIRLRKISVNESGVFVASASKPGKFIICNSSVCTRCLLKNVFGLRSRKRELDVTAKQTAGSSCDGAGVSQPGCLAVLTTALDSQVRVEIRS